MKVKFDDRSALVKRLKRKRRTVVTMEIITIWIVIAGLFAAGFFIYMNSTRIKINLSEYASLAYSGYDTRGTLFVELNDDGAYEDFFKSVSIDISPNTTLSNGDEVLITYTYDKKIAKELKLWVKGTRQVITMHGLPQATHLTVDKLFANASITWEGISPEVAVTVENISQDDFLKTVTFEIADDKTYFAKGDTVTIEAIFDNQKAEAEGYVIEAGEDGYRKEVVIDDVDEYLLDASELTSEQIKQLDAHARTLFGDANEYGLRIFCEAHLIPVYVNGKSTFQWTSPNLISIYFNVMTDESHFGEKEIHINDIKFVYDAAITQSDGVTSGAEAVVRFDSLIKHPDGTIDLNIDSGKIISASGSDRNIKKLVGNQGEEEYTSTKIELP